MQPSQSAAPDLDALLADALARIDRSGIDAIPLIDIADRLGTGRRHADVATLYERWLARSSSPFRHVICFNLGVTRTSLDDLAAAERAYRDSIAQSPAFPQSWFNLGSVLERQGRREEAVAAWQMMLDRSIVDPVASRDLYLLTQNSLGRLCEELRDYARAEEHLRASLAAEPDQPKAIQHWVHLRQKQCEWPVYAELGAPTAGELLRATSPLAMLSASDDPGLQLASAVHFVKQRIDVREPALAPAGGYAHPRLRLGFLSSDLCMHAVGLLTVELFELIDRQRFEVFAFCWTREDGSELRARIRRAIEHFVPIGGVDDRTAAQHIRACEIDVLIDLHGITSGARPEILAHRPAPVQLTYLGFPGPTALPCIDHMIVDRYLVPDEERPFYAETPLYLPEGFQCSDRQRPVGALPTRAQLDLPEDAFVFCCFNNNYKFNVEMFDVWMRILARVPGSVLWLLADNRWSQANLTREAERRGIAPERLRFAGRVAPPDYLARYTAADLFLDCYPFNGGTTANDALWMGLPVLTRSGRTFASRMAGSLLHGVGLPELITTSAAEYEERAVELAGQPGFSQRMRAHLAAARQSSRLFDMPRFVRSFEAALRSVARGPTPR
jgi:predicted O-linked N-acetylglucosamine transferase (SPINDLY family)